MQNDVNEQKRDWRWPGLEVVERGALNLSYRDGIVLYGAGMVRR